MSVNREEILKLFKGLRVTDVNDGLDAVGLLNVCIMDRGIRPLWRDIEQFKHRICGFALTVQYLPGNEAIHATSVDDYYEKRSYWYSEMSPNKEWMALIQKNDVIAIDCSTNTDVGFCGSENSQNWINHGAVGIVTNGGCRDTDELIKQQVPLYSNYIGRGIKPGRIVSNGFNKPVNIGGAMVRPGDLIVADGDGVVVVPIEKVYDVAAYARKISDGDKQKRREHYIKAGKTLDFTVQ